MCDNCIYRELARDPYPPGQGRKGKALVDSVGTDCYLKGKTRHSRIERGWLRVANGGLRAAPLYFQFHFETFPTAARRMNIGPPICFSPGHDIPRVLTRQQDIRRHARLRFRYTEKPRGIRSRSKLTATVFIIEFTYFSRSRGDSAVFRANRF